MSVDKTVTALTNIPLVTLSWSNLELGQMIGSGGYGDVYRATWQGIEVAVKQLHLKTLLTDLAEDFQREVMVMAQCQFPHVVRLYGVCQEPGHTAMVMEYLPKGSLYQVLHDSKELLSRNPVRWNIAIDVGKGLSYCIFKKSFFSSSSSGAATTVATSVTTTTAMTNVTPSSPPTLY